MNPIRRTAIGALLVAGLCVGAAPSQQAPQPQQPEKATLRILWKSAKYQNAPVPGAWRPAKIPAKVNKVEPFVRFSFQTNSLAITEFIGQFGLPDRYLTMGHQGAQDFLIYDLPGGYAVALYVPKPPRDTINSITIISADNTVIKHIR